MDRWQPTGRAERVRDRLEAHARFARLRIFATFAAKRFVWAHLTLLFRTAFWYCPQTMLRADISIWRPSLPLIGGLLLMTSGCAELRQVDVSDLRPGTYCEIEMVVPPNAAENSQQCYMGWVQEVTHDEVVLTKVKEQTNIDYSGSGHSHAMTERKHDLVRVPLTGVRQIWAEKHPKSTAAPPGGSTSPPAKPKLPSDGAHPTAPLPD